MTNRPLGNKFPQFASVTVTVTMPDGSTQQSKIEPDGTHKTNGWGFGEQPPFNYMNWIHGTTYDWLQYFDTVANGFAVKETSPTANMTVTISTGILKAGTGYAQIAEQTTGVITAPTTGNQRIDIVSIGRHDGIAYVTTGVEDPTAPAAPVGAVPENCIALAWLHLTAGMTQILNANIGDVRPEFECLNIDAVKAIIDSGQALDTSRTDQLSIAINNWPPGFIKGLEHSPYITDPAHGVLTTAGKCMDSTDTVRMVLPNDMVKLMNATWVEGDELGGLASKNMAGGADPVTAGDTLIKFLITKPDGTADMGFTKDVNAAGLLADATGYTIFKEMDRWRVYDAGAGDLSLIRTIRRGDHVLVVDNIHNFTTTLAFTTSEQLIDLIMPKLKCIALLHADVDQSTGGANQKNMVLYTPGTPSPFGAHYHHANSAYLVSDWEQWSYQSSIHIVPNENMQVACIGDADGNANVGVTGWIYKRD